MPQMAVGWGKQRRPYHRSPCAGEQFIVRAPEEDRAVVQTPSPGVAGPGYLTG